jgi:glutamate-1-semialdehyde 2,1-aminomutase
LQEAWSLNDSAVPKFFTRGDGCRIWDVEGREFIDYHSGFGANLLGYNHPAVEDAVKKAGETAGPLLSGPTPYSVELAERLVSVRPGATWAFPSKNGTDATTLARVCARASTGKQGILREKAGNAFAYHGASPQWSRGKPGVTDEESSQFEASYKYNDLDSVRKALDSLKGNVAAIFVGGCSYPLSEPTVEPTLEFAQGLRKLADEHGALLIVDEIRTNFRVGDRVDDGSWKQFGVECAPDLYCLCKAFANGHPLSALVGNEKARPGAAQMFATGTFWIGAPPMAACLATLDALEADDCKALKHMQEMGRKFKEGLETLGKKHGLQCTSSGPPALPFMTFDCEEPHHRPLSEKWCVLMAKEGIWLHPHHNWYVTAAHTQHDIDLTLAAADKAFAGVAAEFDHSTKHKSEGYAGGA